jgi:hypothetical protein
VRVVKGACGFVLALPVAALPSSVAHVTWGTASHYQFPHRVRVCARAYHVMCSLA